jgi:hypothetical protein
MKRPVVLFACIVLSICCYAQSDNWYFSFSMGGSRPLGTFNQTNIDKASSGYARNGFSLLLDAVYPLSDHWGMKGMALISTNPVDRNWMGTKLEMRMKAIPVSFAETDREFLSLRVNAWMFNALLAGPVYSVNFDRIFWDFHLLGGMNICYLPQQKILFEKPANNWYYLDRNTTTTFVSSGVLVGTALRFPMSDRFNLRVGADYLHSKATIKYEQIRVSKQGETVLTEKLGNGSASIPIGMITYTVGFVYYLN